MIADCASTIGINLSPPQLGSLLAVIQIHRDEVRGKLQNDALSTDERAVLQQLDLHLESTRHVIEGAITDADLLLTGGSATMSKLSARSVMSDQRSDRDREVVERLADEYAVRATRDVLKPDDDGLSVLDSLAKQPPRRREN